MFSEFSQFFLGFLITVCLCTGVHNLTKVLQVLKAQAQQYNNIIDQLRWMYGFLAVAFLLLSFYQLTWFILFKIEFDFTSPFARYMSEYCIPIALCNLVIVSILVVHRRSFQSPLAGARGQKSSMAHSDFLSETESLTTDNHVTNAASDDFDMQANRANKGSYLGSAASFSKSPTSQGKVISSDNRSSKSLLNNLVGAHKTYTEF